MLPPIMFQNWALLLLSSFRLAAVYHRVEQHHPLTFREGMKKGQMAARDGKRHHWEFSRLS
jgi:hypothetical protein